MRFGLYHSLYEWFNPLWINDKQSNFATDDFVKFKTLPELYELVSLQALKIAVEDMFVNLLSTAKCLSVYYVMTQQVEKYRPEIVWSDGEWEAEDTYWKSKEFLAWLYNESPVNATVVTNDRWGHETLCKHGGYYTCQDRYNPGVLQPHKWENCMTLDKESWGYRRNAKIQDYLEPAELIKTLIETVACGGSCCTKSVCR